jgi:hypothetical protein
MELGKTKTELTLKMKLANSSPQSMGKFMKPQPKCDEMSFEGEKTANTFLFCFSADK